MPSSRKSSTSSSPYLRTVTELSTIVEELREIKNRPIAPQPDIAAAERRLHEYIDAMLPGAVDAGTGHVFDDLIDAYVDEWCAAGFRHHNQVLADLDIIAAQLEAHLAGHEQLASSDKLRVRNSDYALESAMLRLADDDLPTTNPVRGHRTGA
jgi:hypothetical protein